MSIKFIPCFLSLLLLAVWPGMPDRACAETRNIYIGDLITLQIAGQDYSIGELGELFQNFEIVEFTETAEGYLLSLRTFEPGEHKFSLGTMEIVIKVQSTLDDIQRTDFFPWDENVLGSDAHFDWTVPLYGAAGLFVMSGAYLLLRKIRKRRSAIPDPYRLFLQRSSALAPEDDDYFVKLTFYFKQYLESLHQLRIIGKTSTEIMNDLCVIENIHPLLPEIRAWLTNCDKLKFTGLAVSEAEKQAHYLALLNLVAKIAEQKEEAS